MDGEISRFVKVWATATASASYCYALSRSRRHIGSGGGLVRFLLILPVICLFCILPYSLSSLHLGGTTFFYLVWLGNFKLLLFAFDLGPLSPPNDAEPLTFAQFLCICLLPIKVRQHYSENSPKPDPNAAANKRTENGGPVSEKDDNNNYVGRSVLFAVKIVILAAVIRVFFEQKRDLSTPVLLAMYCCQVYVVVETVLAAAAAFARVVLGLQLEDQFNDPYLSTSLQDFWGRRWNLMVSDILRQTTYNPIRRVCSPTVGKKCASLIGVMASFTVSALMHEWIYHYFTRVTPTWEVTCFFVLHGVCLCVEMLVKTSTKWRLHRVVSTPLTLAFVAGTGLWLFFPQLLRNHTHLRSIEEYRVVVDFVKNNVLYYRNRMQ